MVVAVVEADVVTLPSTDKGGWKVPDNLETDADFARRRVDPKNPLALGVALRRENVVIDIMDVAEPGRGLGLGLGGAPPSESVVSAEEYALVVSGNAMDLS